MPRIHVARTYLDMTSRGDLCGATITDPHLRVERVIDCPPALFRWLYVEVGREFRWVERLAWTDDDIRAYLAEPGVEFWILYEGKSPAGYFELRQAPDCTTEIVYFGLLPAFTGRGLGKHLLTVAVEQAWAARATRVWLHTSSLDHPAALPNYIKRGFRAYRTETFEVDV